MTHVKCNWIRWSSLLLLLAGTSSVLSKCSTICEHYNTTPLPTVDSGRAMSLAVSYYETYLRLRNNSTLQLFTSREVCTLNEPQSVAYCNLINYTNDLARGISVGFFCDDLEDLRGQKVTLALEMLENESNCVVLLDSFVFQKSKCCNKC